MGESMAALFADGRIVDAILILVVLQYAALCGYRWRTGRGLGPVDLFFNLGAGAALLLALQAGLRGAEWPWIACFLLLGLGAHLADLYRRWPRR
jgi:hypothetical protein